jgi:hypothetical protein
MYHKCFKSYLTLRIGYVSQVFQIVLSASGRCLQCMYSQTTVFNTTWRCGKMLLFTRRCGHLNAESISAYIKVLSRTGIVSFAFFYKDWTICNASRTETGRLFLVPIYPWRWKCYVPLNRQDLIVEGRSFLSQKNRIAIPPRKSEHLERPLFKMSILHG